MENQMRVSGNPLSTQKSYIRGVRDLMEMSGSIPELLSVDEIKAHLVSWCGKVSSSALNLRVCGIKLYFRQVIFRPDLAVGIPNPRVAKYVQSALSESDLAVLFGACRRHRELALLHLLFDSGLRSREVCGLKLTDFDRVHQHFTVTGKGNKKRTLPYSPELRQTLAAYFKSEASQPCVYLFENRQNDGTPITVRGVQYIVKEVLKRSKLKKEVHPHTFRHSFAVHHINNGGNLLRLQQLMGHEDIETTLHYLKFCSIPLTDSSTPLSVMLNRAKKAVHV
jgi:integrase/recombinase XerD